MNFESTAIDRISNEKAFPSQGSLSLLLNMMFRGEHSYSIWHWLEQYWSLPSWNPSSQMLTSLSKIVVFQEISVFELNLENTLFFRDHWYKFLKLTLEYQALQLEVRMYF